MQSNMAKRSFVERRNWKLSFQTSNCLLLQQHQSTDRFTARRLWDEELPQMHLLYPSSTRALGETQKSEQPCAGPCSKARSLGRKPCLILKSNPLQYSCLGSLMEGYSPKYSKQSDTIEPLSTITQGMGTITQETQGTVVVVLIYAHNPILLSQGMRNGGRKKQWRASVFQGFLYLVMGR